MLDSVALARPTHEGAEVVLAAGRPPAGSTSTSCAPRSRATPVGVALVSVMWANNEVGTVQPVARDRRRSPHEHGIPVHTDAVQAVGQVPVDFAASGST